jgi:NADH-quinone oxidoreductase subunit K
MLISLELALLGLFLCFASVSICCLNPHGQLYCLLILVAAASESAVGLALIVVWSRANGSLSVLGLSRVKG